MRTQKLESRWATQDSCMEIGDRKGCRVPGLGGGVAHHTSRQRVGDAVAEGQGPVLLLELEQRSGSMAAKVQVEIPPEATHSNQHPEGVTAACQMDKAAGLSLEVAQAPGGSLGKPRT